MVFISVLCCIQFFLNYVFLIYLCFSGGAQGQAEDIRVEASQIMRIRNNLVKMYSLMTGQTTDQITLDLDRFVYAYV